MFDKLFKRKNKKEPQFIVANLNARIMPLERAELFEEPLDALLSERSLGEITGGTWSPKRLKINHRVY